MGFLNLRSWYLYNIDTSQIFQSQFEPEGLTRNIQSNYAEHTALNRANPIIQFLNKQAEVCTFNSTLWRRDVVFNSVEEDFALLQSWVEPLPKINRPPLLVFSVGDGHYNLDCIMTGLTNVVYDRPTLTGGVRRITFTVTLKQYQEFTLDSGVINETLYYRVKERDYYELIAQRQYGDPLKGDVIRKRNPSKAIMQVADQIPFPDAVAIRRDRVEQKSLILSTAYGKKLTSQKENRLDMFDRRNRNYTSHVILEH